MICRLIQAAMRTAAIVLAAFGPMALAVTSAHAQISLTSGYTQSFDTLASTASSSVLPSGWFILETGTNANVNYTPGTGSSNAGDTYSFGTAGSAERALGGILSGSLTPTFGAQFVNNTGAPITSLTIAYTGEQWRLGTANRGADRLEFQYSLDATSLATGNWTAVDALNFSSPMTAGTVGPLDGNAAGNRTAVISTISGLNIPVGATFWIRWTDFNASGADDGLAVDDFTIAATSTVDAPVVGNCPASFSATAGIGGTVAVQATDADDAVTSAAITSGAVAGITLPFTPSASPGTPLTATLTVAASVVAGSYPLVLTFANADVPPQSATCALTVTMIPTVATTHIRDIQGAGHVSPLNGMNVAFVPGVVTALRTNGFYMEDWAPDANPATSEGIFVFTVSAPTVSVGQTVLVTGTVTEFRPGGDVNSLTVTEISPVTGIFLAPTQETLPPPVVIGIGGRVPPAQTIYTGTGNVETSGTFDPAVDGVDFYESLEGMRVRINGAAVVGPTNAFGETWVLADAGANAGLRTARGGIVARPGDFNPERIQIDDTLIIAGGPMPKANVGDSYQSLVGIVDYSFSNYEVLLTVAPPLVPGTNAPEITALVSEPDRLTVASYNVENLQPNNAAAKFAALASQIVANLRAPDIVAAIEVQDNNGATNNGVVGAATTLQMLVNAIAAAGGPTYQWRQIDPVDGQDGGEPGGNIRVAFLYNPGRVSFVDRPGGTSTAAVGVTNVSGVPQLSFSPGRIDPLNVAFNSSRKPLAGEFLFNGNRLFVIANHFNSKGGDQPLFGPNQPPVLSSEVQRNQQATIVRNFVQQILAIDAGANVLVLGDLNDFEFSTPLTILKSASLTPLVETLPPEERYTYVFEGNSQALDHIMASSALLNASTQYDVVHVNAEYANQTSDHDPEVARFFLPRRDPQDPADLNGDGKVDCADLAIVKSISTWGKRVGEPGFDARADANRDGIVDIRDWMFVRGRAPTGMTCGQ